MAMHFAPPCTGGSPVCTSHKQAERLFRYQLEFDPLVNAALPLLKLGEVRIVVSIMYFVNFGAQMWRSTLDMVVFGVL